MPVKLNLLPPELAISKNLGNLLKGLRAVGVIAIAAFLVMALGMGAFFVISTIALKSINADISSLTSRVRARETSEQQIILLKDRITKISSVQNLPNSLSSITTLEPLLGSIGDTSSISQLTISPLTTGLSVNINSNAGLSLFLDSLKNSKVFKSITLTSFSLNPATGYSVEVNIVNK